MDYPFINRTNLVFEPTTSNGSLVLVLHGGFGTPSFMQNATKLEEVFTESYVVYPSSDSTKLWKAGNQDVDVAYLHSLIHQLVQDYPEIDLTKVHLVGHSNGGMMCYKLAAYLSKFPFASINTLSACYIADDTFEYTGPVYHYHTVNDLIVPIEGGQVYPSLTWTMDAVKSANCFFDIRSFNTMSDDDAHKMAKIIENYPTIFTEMKTRLGI